MSINPEHYFILCTGQNIKSLEELLDVLKKIDKKTFEYHVNDSKNDFSNWIRFVFKSKRLAETIADYGYHERPLMIKAIKRFLSEKKILIINAGSSSIKFQLIELTTKNVLIKGMVDRIGLDGCTMTIEHDGAAETKNVLVNDHEQALNAAIDALFSSDIIGDITEISAVGHRVVHGGELYRKPVIIDDDVIKNLKELSSLAPLHNPSNVQGIIACQKIIKSPQVAVFDTAFHSTIPKEKFLYGLPYEYYEKHKIRKYGFHGSSHKYIADLIGEYYRIKKKKHYNIIICHLGNGSSITAVKDGKSLNTTMGFAPVDGLIMGTRVGSLDPVISIHMGEHFNLGYEDLSRIFNKQSGLLGISGYSDMRLLRKNQKEPRCRLAMGMFADRVTHFIGAYIAELNGVDGIVFTAGIGENAFYIRKKILDNFSYLGLKLDNKKNEKNDFIITSKDSKIDVFVMKTNEELQIAYETRQLLKI